MQNKTTEVSVEVNVQYELEADSSTVTLRDATTSPSPEQWQAWLHQWLVTLQPNYSPINSYEVSLYLTTNAVIQQLNQQYRQQDKPTDVLAFAMLDGDRQPASVLEAIPFSLGDIVISVDVAKQQAIANNHSLTVELAWLAAHGLLHLLGWDHPTDERLQQMLAQQQILLSTIQLSPRFDF